MMIEPWIQEEEVESLKKLASFLRTKLAGEDGGAAVAGVTVADHRIDEGVWLRLMRGVQCWRWFLQKLNGSPEIGGKRWRLGFWWWLSWRGKTEHGQWWLLREGGIEVVVLAVLARGGVVVPDMLGRRKW
ncbi:uncharacterized protein LOC130722239 [Lotus japonicus]|uniref:uncharacterized protein LOC130722238 n=1 Tax=Lotus japonicus TaxID=34305 RepID=UPI00258EEE53|nr:uncharacterized protein LOC130722238 [Lotus japonicus]XP_057428896.1 uncharacterized protein LOC130722239 [Lotus japonicus]